jgi:Ca2+-binding EF-hand superfamily protein
MKTFIFAASILGASALISGAYAHDWHHGGGEPSEHADQKFKELDANGDGVVTWAEFNAMAEQHFAEADADKNGLISYEESLKAHEARHGADGDQDGKGRHEGGKDGMFFMMDIDNDGMVSREEVSVLTSRMFRDMDANGDGKVTALEAKAAAREHAFKMHAMRDRD